MQINYEVNRLAKSYLSSAYEKLIPIIKLKIKPNEEETEIEDIQPLKRNIQ